MSDTIIGMNYAVKTLLVIMIGTLLACSSNYKPKATLGSKAIRNIEFTSQGAILRGKLYLPEGKSIKDLWL